MMHTVAFLNREATCIFHSLFIIKQYIYSDFPEVWTTLSYGLCDHNATLQLKYQNVWLYQRPLCRALWTPSCSSEAQDRSQTASSPSGPWHWTTQTQTSVWEIVCTTAICIIATHTYLLKAAILFKAVAALYMSSSSAVLWVHKHTLLRKQMLTDAFVCSTKKTCWLTPTT